MNAKEKLADYQRQFGVYAEANPEVMGAFGATVTAAMENSGPLDAKTMELLILVAAVSRKCEPCIYSHVMNYINVGGTKEELAAGLNAAVLICGGPGMAYSALALDLFDQYSAEQYLQFQHMHFPLPFYDLDWKGLKESVAVAFISIPTFESGFC